MGTTKVQQSPPSSQEHVKQLPSIWTTQGFRTFADIRGESCRISSQPRSGGTGGSDAVLVADPRPATTGSTCTPRSARAANKSRKAPATVLPLPFHSGQKYKEYSMCRSEGVVQAFAS